MWKSVLHMGRDIDAASFPWTFADDTFERNGLLPLTRDAALAFCSAMNREDKLIVALASALAGPHTGEFYHDCIKTFYHGVCCADDPECESWMYVIPVTPHVLWAMTCPYLSPLAQRVLATLVLFSWGQGQNIVTEFYLKVSKHKSFPTSAEIREGLRELIDRNMVTHTRDCDDESDKRYLTWIKRWAEHWILSTDERRSLDLFLGTAASNILYPIEM